MIILFLKESIVDASEDSQLRAAIAASLACTTSTLNEENSDEDEDEDFDDLEFSESDSEEEHKTPQKNNNKSSTSVKKEVKRGINFDESNKAKGACNKGNGISQSEHLSTNSVEKKSTARVDTNKLEKREAEVCEADSSSEEKDDSSNHRTQEQAGKRDQWKC